MRNLFIICFSIFPSLANASDMGPILYFLSIPIGLTSLIVSVIVGFSVKIKLAINIVLALSITSAIFGWPLLSSYSYQDSGSIYTLQQIVVFGFFFPITIIGLRAYKSKEKKDA